MRSGIGSVGKALSVRRECSNPVIRLISLSRSCSRLSCILFFCSFLSEAKISKKYNSPIFQLQTYRMLTQQAHCHITKE